MTTENQNFEEQAVLLDGQKFVRCTFTKCNLVYEGGIVPYLHENTFIDCVFNFDGSAGRTLLFLKTLNQGGLSELVLQLTEDIRANRDLGEIDKK